MLVTKNLLLLLLVLVSGVTCGKLKFLAHTHPHHGFIGLKWRTPKLLGLKHKLGHGFGGGSSFHSSGYEHHEYHHSSHHSGGGLFGGKLGWLGK